MKKAELIEELNRRGIAFNEKDTVPVLKELLKAATGSRVSNAVKDLKVNRPEVIEADGEEKRQVVYDAKERATELLTQMEKDFTELYKLMNGVSNNTARKCTQVARYCKEQKKRFAR